MSFATAYRLRLRRKRLLWRAKLRSRDLAPAYNRTSQIRPDDILLFAVFRNEEARVPWFLKHYRSLGVNHFLIVDNASHDGTVDHLRDNDDVSIWQTPASYRKARFGVDWLNDLRRVYGSGHWCLTVDADELLVYPHHPTRPLAALADWLDRCNQRTMPALLLDMYPEGPVESAVCPAGTDPLATVNWFDAGNYSARLNRFNGNYWVQGGVRARAFFPDQPEIAPALNKIPFVRWERSYAYASSTHSLMPRGLNRDGEDLPSGPVTGCLLHTKLVAGFAGRAREELRRKQHYGNGVEYAAYARMAERGLSLWTEGSTRFRDWRQLHRLGLMQSGCWG